MLCPSTLPSVRLAYTHLGHTATVFGATGFLGRYVVNNLGRSRGFTRH